MVTFFVIRCLDLDIMLYWFTFKLFSLVIGTMVCTNRIVYDICPPAPSQRVHPLRRTARPWRHWFGCGCRRRAAPICSLVVEAIGLCSLFGVYSPDCPLWAGGTWPAEIGTIFTRLRTICLIQIVCYRFSDPAQVFIILRRRYMYIIWNSGNDNNLYNSFFSRY